jgi:hypothetical protein
MSRRPCQYVIDADSIKRALKNRKKHKRLPNRYQNFTCECGNNTKSGEDAYCPSCIRKKKAINDKIILARATGGLVKQLKRLKLKLG